MSALLHIDLDSIELLRYVAGGNTAATSGSALALDKSENLSMVLIKVYHALHTPCPQKLKQRVRPHQARARQKRERERENTPAPFMFLKKDKDQHSYPSPTVADLAHSFGGDDKLLSQGVE
ncbi:MAG: hypothetical protein M1828_001801 [Chrysothrix sp. TS-e1954]|nr:MAG: hypothetical protein M1828_001801 [Chrysothrix sp. TS-e1954]